MSRPAPEEERRLVKFRRLDYGSPGGLDVGGLPQAAEERSRNRCFQVGGEGILSLPVEVLFIILAYAWSWELNLPLTRVCKTFREVAHDYHLFQELPLPRGGFPCFWVMRNFSLAKRTAGREVFMSTIPKFRSFRPSPSYLTSRSISKPLILPSPMIDSPTKEWIHAHLVCARESGESFQKHKWRALTFSNIGELGLREHLSRCLLTGSPELFRLNSGLIRIDSSDVMRRVWTGTKWDNFLKSISIYVNSIQVDSWCLFRDELIDYIPLIWDQVKGTLTRNLHHFTMSKLFDVVMRIILAGPVVEPEKIFGNLLHSRHFKSSRERYEWYVAVRNWISKDLAQFRRMEARFADLRTSVLICLRQADDVDYFDEEIVLAYNDQIDISSAIASCSNPRCMLEFISRLRGRQGVVVKYSAMEVCKRINDVNIPPKIQLTLRRRIADAVTLMIYSRPPETEFWKPLYEALVVDSLDGIDCINVNVINMETGISSVQKWAVFLRMLPLIRLDWMKSKRATKGNCQHCQVELKRLCEAEMERRK